MDLMNFAKTSPFALQSDATPLNFTAHPDLHFVTQYFELLLLSIAFT